MRDAFGGVMNIVIVAVFLVIVSGILGLLVNYTKAFRMKNSIINVIEQYEGSDYCFPSENSGSGSTCQSRINEAAGRYGYSPTVLRCPSDYGKSGNLFCYKQMPTDDGSGIYYSVITQVDINIPIINQITGLSIFQVHGETRPIKKTRR